MIHRHQNQKRWTTKKERSRKEERQDKKKERSRKEERQDEKKERLMRYLPLGKTSENAAFETTDSET
jgi:hypothetical protein